MEKKSNVTDLAKEMILKLKQIKDEKGLGLNELSLLCDINKAQMSKFFNFKINLSFNNFLNILDKLGYEVVLTPKEKEPTQ